MNFDRMIENNLSILIKDFDSELANRKDCTKIVASIKSIFLYSIFNLVRL